MHIPRQTIGLSETVAKQPKNRNACRFSSNRAMRRGDFSARHDEIIAICATRAEAFVG